MNLAGQTASGVVENPDGFKEDNHISGRSGAQAFRGFRGIFS